MMNTYDFQIAGLYIRVRSPFPLTELFELSAFAAAYDPDKPPDAIYTLELLPENWTIKGEKLSENQRCAIFQWKNELHRYFHWSIYSQDRFILLRSVKGQPHYTIYLQEAFLHRILPQFRLASFLAPEELLLNHDAFLLHAAVVNWQDGAVLFTGPSGIGKSTQADLWARLEGAEIINGDRAIIRYSHDQFTAWGSPYAGTSRIYKNRGVPIRAIVCLSQAKTNTLYPLTGLNAFQNLLREATTAPWDPNFMSRLTDLLLKLSAQIPIYHLSCTPTADAVDILKEMLTK